MTTGYQFGHINCYSAKKADNICDEASRKEYASGHIGTLPDHTKTPRPPTHLYGISLDECKQEKDFIMSTHKIHCKDGKEKKIRSDAVVMIGFVGSYPLKVDDYLADEVKYKSEIDNWIECNKQFLQKEYGNALRNMTLHLDESYVHIHAIIVSADCAKLHSGFKAQNEKIKSITESIKSEPTYMQADKKQKEALDKEIKLKATKAGSCEFKRDMRKWQDNYYETVGKPCGLTRDGPKRHRESRKDWHLRQEKARIEKQQQENLDALNKRNAELTRENERLSKQVLVISKREKDVEKRERNAGIKEENLETRISEIDEYGNQVRQQLEIERKDFEASKIAGSKVGTFVGSISNAFSNMKDNHQDKIKQAERKELELEAYAKELKAKERTQLHDRTECSRLRRENESLNNDKKTLIIEVSTHVSTIKMQSEKIQDIALEKQIEQRKADKTISELRRTIAGHNKEKELALADLKSRCFELEETNNHLNSELKRISTNEALYRTELFTLHENVYDRPHAWNTEEIERRKPKPKVVVETYTRGYR